MTETNVINVEVNYDRTGHLDLVDDLVIFDTSNEEYGPVKFSLKLLEEKIKEHKKKLNEGRINK